MKIILFSLQDIKPFTRLNGFFLTINWRCVKNVLVAAFFVIHFQGDPELLLLMGAYSDVYQLIITSIFHQLFLNCKTHVCTQYLLLCKLKKTSPWLVISYRRCWSWISIIDGFIHNNLSSAIFFLANIDRIIRHLIGGAAVKQSIWSYKNNSTPSFFGMVTFLLERFNLIPYMGGGGGQKLMSSIFWSIYYRKEPENDVANRL